MIPRELSNKPYIVDILRQLPVESVSQARIQTLSNGTGRMQTIYQCVVDECGQLFTHVENFRSHLRKHLGLRVFRCKRCKTFLSTKGILKSHKSICTQRRRQTSPKQPFKHRPAGSPPAPEEPTM